MYASINLRRNPRSLTDPIPVASKGWEGLEQAAQGCGEITIPERVHKACKCDAYEHGLVVYVVMSS